MDADSTAPTGPTWERLAKAASNQKWFKQVKLAQIATAAAIPVTAAFGASVKVAAVLGAVLVVLEGVQALFGFQPNWASYRKTAEALKRERYLYLAQAGQYAGEDREKVLALVVEGLISDETSQWVAAQQEQLGRPAEPREQPNGTIGLVTQMEEPTPR
jgi:hypothetical protein